MKNSIVYIGELPPPYGGVAVKNKLVFQSIFAEEGAKMIDLVECKRVPWKIPIIFSKITWNMFKCHTVIIGVGTNKRLKVLLSMQRFLTGKKGLSKIMIMVMGGEFHERLKQDDELCEMCKYCRSVWVESNEMINSLSSQGVHNSRLFPNCRTDAQSMKPIDCVGAEDIRYVFFSRICAEKGIDIIMQVVERLNRKNIPFQMDFYGEVDTTIETKFREFINEYNNVKYHGVYDATNGNAYQELNQYDVMLLPSRWKGEGVPGTLVESKMAGITAVVSDWNFNKEVVLDSKEGVVLKQCSVDALVSTIERFQENHDGVQQLKQGAYESRKRYCIDTYRHVLLDECKRR